MNDKINDLLYQSGITAQGCWDKMDEYDRDAILRFGKLVIAECIDAVKHTDTRHAYTTYDRDTVDSTIERSVKSIKERFDYE